VIAIDTSSLVAFFQGLVGDDVEAVEHALTTRQAALPVIVLAEILSDHLLPSAARRLLRQLPRLDISQNYWENTGQMRASLRSSKLKSRLGDALIAQSCIDHEVALITRDRDFRHYARFGLMVVVSLR
jgi:predicted nucleic acid-binding protein